MSLLARYHAHMDNSSSRLSELSSITCTTNTLRLESAFFLFLVHCNQDLTFRLMVAPCQGRKTFSLGILFRCFTYISPCQGWHSSEVLHVHCPVSRKVLSLGALRLSLQVLYVHCPVSRRDFLLGSLRTVHRLKEDIPLKRFTYIAPCQGRDPY